MHAYIHRRIWLEPASEWMPICCSPTGSGRVSAAALSLASLTHPVYLFVPQGAAAAVYKGQPISEGPDCMTGTKSCRRHTTCIPHDYDAYGIQSPSLLFTCRRLHPARVAKTTPCVATALPLGVCAVTSPNKLRGAFLAACKRELVDLQHIWVMSERIFCYEN